MVDHRAGELSKGNIKLCLQNFLQVVRCCLLLWSWFCSGIRILLAQENPLFVLLMLFLLQLFLSLLQQFLFDILRHIGAGSNPMSLFPR